MVFNGFQPFVDALGVFRDWDADNSGAQLKAPCKHGSAPCMALETSSKSPFFPCFPPIFLGFPWFSFDSSTDSSFRTYISYMFSTWCPGFQLHGVLGRHLRSATRPCVCLVSSAGSCAFRSPCAAKPSTCSTRTRPQRPHSKRRP